MKQTLLLTFLLFFGIMIFAQSESGKASVYRDNGIELTIYPNPFTNYIKIDDQDDIVEFVTIYNLLGKKMKRLPAAKGESYYVADLPRGMYLVQLEGKKSKVLKTQRIKKNQ